jgi:pyridoxamine 5'-phosphate oxidase
MAINTEIAELRKEYRKQKLSENEVPNDPMILFEKWWNEALQSKGEEINAMTLATCNGKGQPSARIVLLKGFSNDGFIFFTNYKSRKGKDMEQNPFAALVFHWKELERQVRIEGTVEKINNKDSADYFALRPQESKLGAWSSPQSEVIKDRSMLEDNMELYRQKFSNGIIPKPDNWGGYIVKPALIEFWQGRPGRLHDRLQYTANDLSWKIERLAP